MHPTRHASDRSLGRFLCLHPPGPPYEDVTRLPLQDIKQDACLRALVALRRAGKPVGPDPIAAFDAEPRLVALAYRRAYQDALRHHLGRGRNPSRRAARWQRLVSLDRGLLEVADPRQQEALDRVLRQIAAVARIAAYWNTGLPGVSVARSRRLLRALRLAQRLKEDGTLVVPPHLREQLRRLREATGLLLSSRLL
ncbi:MAG: hypothetical protein M3Q10_05390 [Chloroflexota bacterium]|nr:hypothetical protein [Chloroflexota bacterium]